ncbi:hypothetical protein GUK30_26465 [Rhizobium leguminosarum]|uniref:hypothetical protein n=1 Tax=Rhizobium TaxID=379 RepID=UPI00103D04B2|nr:MULTISPECIES: hypothetical protein [Rhizobium]NEI22949.1 hypothetical protein [Rhizobium ruizarguesonis]TCA70480.1 hypothetical protein E0H69_25640 [Rhizobium leguminosarum bv. viciae]WSH59869.1 hypothetical protein U8P68_11140 [Rhizobium ruizarguesonis]
MPNKNIPDGHHVARVCPKNRVIRDRQGRPVGVFPQLYKLREKTDTRPREEYLSASYVEFFGVEHAQCLKDCVRTSAFPVKAADFMVMLNAGLVRQIGASYNLRLKVVHDTANKKNPAYAKIVGTPHDPTHAILGALAATTVSTLVSVEDINR